MCNTPEQLTTHALEKYIISTIITPIQHVTFKCKRCRIRSFYQLTKLRIQKHFGITNACFENSKNKMRQILADTIQNPTILTCFIAKSYSGMFLGRKPGSVVLAWNKQNHIAIFTKKNTMWSSWSSFQVYGKHWKKKEMEKLIKSQEDERQKLYFRKKNCFFQYSNTSM